MLRRSVVPACLSFPVALQRSLSGIEERLLKKKKDANQIEKPV